MGAVYINNCRFGLHGPLEVLSSSAVGLFVVNLPSCDNLLVQTWGEDKFMDRCMLQIGVTRVNLFGVLSETACGEQPAPCTGDKVAFHPFKSVNDYFTCWTYANMYGKWPPTKYSMNV